MRTFVAFVIVVAACHKPGGDSEKAKQVFARWELGWRRSQACILGKVGRSPDAATQAELAQLYGERGDCPDWFSDNNHNIANVSALDSDKKRGEQLSANENAVNIFTELEPADLSDEQADAITKLIEAFDDARLHWPKGVAELVAARAHARSLFGLPDDKWEITRPTKVTDLALKPPPPEPPRESNAIPDPADPIEWAQDLQPNGAHTVTVLKPKKQVFHDVGYIGHAGRRLDLVLNTTPLTWVWFEPGKRQKAPMKLAGVDGAPWVCAAPHALWLLAGDNGDQRVVRYDPANPESPQTGRAPDGGGAVCDDKAAAYRSGQTLCLAGKDCDNNAAAPGATLVDGQLVNVTTDRKSAVFGVRVGKGPDHVFRLPAKKVFSVLSVHDGKPYAYCADGAEGELPWPLDQ